MGAWGVGPFDNDDALDLLYLLEKDPRRVLVDRFDAAVRRRSDEMISVDEAGVVVAAAALVGARVTGEPAGEATADEWLDANPGFEVDSELRDLTLTALRRVAADSELRDLMAEEDLVESWDEEVLTLMGRLVSGT